MGSYAPVEVIIPCHSADRPLGRSVESALAQGGDARVTVVAHNLPISDLKAVVPSSAVPRVNWLHLNDGENSPAGPFMHGLDQSEANWVIRLDSDDWLETDAVVSWLRLSAGFDAVIPRLQYDSGQIVRTPPQRSLPHRRRDAVKDRLYYRSAPLGLLRRAFLIDHGLGLDLGIRTGEDLRMSSLLWSKGKVTTDLSGPAYIVGTAAGDRITGENVPLVEDFPPLLEAWKGGWASQLPSRQRQALATKYLRIHFFGAAYNRALARQWLPGDREALAEGIEVVLANAPGSERPLSIADRELLDALLDPLADDEQVSDLAVARRRFGTWKTLVPRDLAYILDREAPPRFMAASAVMR